MTKEKYERCPRCGAAFGCGVSRGEGSCWCMSMPTLPAQYRQGKGCYCPACLKALTGLPTEAAPLTSAAPDQV
ncbi:cysteine-rich CWC family protein [Denitratisoma sp. agr-D3]